MATTNIEKNSDTDNESSGFDRNHFKILAALEENSFWFTARNHLILWAVRSQKPAVQSLLEIGCGTGFVLKRINDCLPDIELFGSELFMEGLEFAASRLPTVKLMQLDATKIPFVDRFDAIGAFDVLEHIREDELVLTQISRALKPEGCLIITVPQHKFLWSPADTLAHHVRRYERLELINKVEAAGFSVIRISSFVSLLLPAMIASRFIQKIRPRSHDVFNEASIGGFSKKILDGIMNLERQLIFSGVDFLAGGSLLLVAKKVRKSG